MPVGDNSKMFYDNCFVSYNLPINIESIKKKEREKVWEMARKIVDSPDFGGMKFRELEDGFGTRSVSNVLRMPVDEALEKYEAWKKTNSVEELIKSLKPQDVVTYNSGINFDYRILMITRVITLDGKRYTFDGITCDGRTIVLHIFIDDGEFIIEKIGRVVETTDILGEIKKIEDEWRKSRCGS